MFMFTVAVRFWSWIVRPVLVEGERVWMEGPTARVGQEIREPTRFSRRGSTFAALEVAVAAAAVVSFEVLEVVAERSMAVASASASAPEVLLEDMGSVFVRVSSSLT